jgi:hypothetical protein
VIANKWSAEFLSDFDTSHAVRTPIEARADEWMDEYSMQQQQKNGVKLDYWSDLESQWDTLAHEQPDKFDWLSEYNSQPLYDEYQMQVGKYLLKYGVFRHR